MVTKVLHLIVNKTCNIACIAVKFGILHPPLNTYHIKNHYEKYSSVVHVSGHEISTTNHLNKTGNTYVTKVKFGRLIPFMKFYHTKKKIQKIFDCRPHILSRNFHT